MMGSSVVLLRMHMPYILTAPEARGVVKTELSDTI